jgi:hypothetical protein
VGLLDAQLVLGGLDHHYILSHIKKCQEGVNAIGAFMHLLSRIHNEYLYSFKLLEFGICLWIYHFKLIFNLFNSFISKEYSSSKELHFNIPSVLQPSHSLFYSFCFLMYVCNVQKQNKITSITGVLNRLRSLPSWCIACYTTHK